MFAYVGNHTYDYTPESAKPQPDSGVYGYDVDLATGSMEFKQFVPTPSPTYIAVSRLHESLYGASHIAMLDGELGGAIYSYSIDPATGILEPKNHVVVPVPHPMYVQTDRTEGYLLAAAAQGGGVMVLPIADDGALEPPSSVQMHRGNPLVPLGELELDLDQEWPENPCQPHSIGVDPSNRVVVVPDCRGHRVVLYWFDESTGQLTPTSSEDSVPPERYSRQVTFHPNGNIFYVLNEYGQSVTVFSLDTESGTASELTTVPTLPQDWTGTNLTAHIVLSKDSRFLYCSNRGHDSIAMFRVSTTSPYLESIGWQSSGGERPRHFAITPGGELLITANQNSSNIASYFIDAESGLIEPTGHSVDVLTPTCVAFF